ncbi:MAG: PKD domain-containing protein, partial [Methanoregula sp.]|nr:PKD domain-containing protein [Methanoregula sp.]
MFTVTNKLQMKAGISLLILMLSVQIVCAFDDNGIPFINGSIVKSAISNDTTIGNDAGVQNESMFFQISNSTSLTLPQIINPSPIAISIPEQTDNKSNSPTADDSRLSAINISDVKDLTPSKEEMEEIIASLQPVVKYKENLTQIQAKIPMALLQLSDPNYPQSVDQRQELKKIMIAKNQLVPADLADIRFNLSDKFAHSDQVYVYVYLKANTSLSTFNQYITNITDQEEKLHFIIAWVDLYNLEKIATSPEVSKIRLVEPPQFESESNFNVTEGDHILGTDSIRNNYGFRGSGVKIGVISNGVDHLSNAISYGDLPSSVHVLDNTTHGDEGTAMLEIVYDLAPDADLYFHDSGITPSQFHNAIIHLIAAGCTIICDDTYFPNEEFFEDGISASLVQQALDDHPEVIYITSAGNSASLHYQGDFYDDGRISGWNDFSRGSSSSRKYLYVTIPPNEEISVYLQWNDDWGNSLNDYDLFLYSYINGVWVNKRDSQNRQGVESSDPYEIIRFNNDGITPIDAQIWVRKLYPTTQIKNLELYIYRTPGVTIGADNLVNSDSIFGHKALPDVITVGAIDARYNDGYYSTIEPFSSRGPSTISFPTPVSRSKPDICGVDNVNISGAGGFPNPFRGTSAASPHIAGVVGLVKGAFPWLSPAQIKDKLYTQADVVGYITPGNTYGHGRANALKIFQNIYGSGMAVAIWPTAGSGGSISPGSIVNVPIGESQTFSVTPNVGYEINTVFVDGISRGAISNYTFTNVQATSTINVTFRPQISPLIANFTANRTSGRTPLVVQFTDLSTGSPNSWKWNFGDGQTSTIRNPVHSFIQGGAYTIALNVTNATRSNTLTRTDYIIVNGDKIGVFRNSTHMFYLDYNGNGTWDGAVIDRAYAFGTTGDLPVSGDWNGDGISAIGIFRPSTHQFVLDYNENGVWNSGTDIVYNLFGDTGDLPVSGDWNVDGRT